MGFSEEFVDRTPSQDQGQLLNDALTWLTEARPSAQNYWPALALSLVAQIDSLATSEGVDHFDDVFESNPPEGTSSSARRPVYTLNFTGNRSPGTSIKLRPLYNDVLHVIQHVMLRSHPSNPGHATQSWPAYRPLIKLIGQMSPGDRRAFAERVWDIGVLAAPEREISTVTERATRPFELVLREMPTSVPRVRGGAILQGIAYGYLRADSPNLILESHNVNTGSSRAGMLGDVDGFRGNEPELAAEVKDIHLTPANVFQQLRDFFEDIENASNVTAIVFCRDITDEARRMISEYFQENTDADGERITEARPGVTVLDVRELVRRVSVWDVPKQQEALRGVEYYLGRIQKDDRAVAFLRDWLRGRDVEII
ncbi:MAG: hypothetical protein AAGC61_02990 [Microbacterium sp.]